MTLPLSRKQIEVLRALQSFSRSRGHIPSVRELAHRLRKSPTTVFQHLKALEKKGYLQGDGTAHGWRPAMAESSAELHRPEVKEDWVRVPVSGTIAAGAPLEAIEDTTEHMILPRGLVPEGAFALRVKGESMIEDHILDGDLVIIRPQVRVLDGEVAVALLPDGAATLKRVFREKNRVRLQPANSAMKPIFATEVRIQGKVIGVWRSSR